jgi:hypothetical protein
VRRPKDDKPPPGSRNKPARVLNGDARAHDEASDKRTTSGSETSKDVSGRKKKGAAVGPQAATCALVPGREGRLSIPGSEPGGSGESARPAR